jgi:hypothetical protein
MSLKKYSQRHKKLGLNHFVILQGLVWILKQILLSKIGNFQDQ